MKNLFLGLYIFSYAAGLGTGMFLVRQLIVPRRIFPTILAAYYCLLTLAILGPNLDFFLRLFGSRRLGFGEPLSAIVVLFSAAIVLGLAAFAIWKAAGSRPAEASFRRLFWVLATVNLGALVFWGLGSIGNARPEFLSALFLGNAAYLIANAGFLTQLIYGAKNAEVKNDSKLTRYQAPLQDLAALGLSEREKEIVALLNQGLAGKEIAYELGITAVTVKNHIYNIYQKTGVKGRVELLNLFRQKPGVGLKSL